MNDCEPYVECQRTLGRLEESMESTKFRLNSIENKIDSLNAWKLKIAGGAAVVSFLFTSLMHYLLGGNK